MCWHIVYVPNTTWYVLTPPTVEAKKTNLTQSYSVFQAIVQPTATKARGMETFTEQDGATLYIDHRDHKYTARS